MKACAVLIVILLGLLLKVSSGENSTKVYYVELSIEENAYTNFTNLLKQIGHLNVNNATVKDFAITTECFNDSSNQVNCSCCLNYTWSDEVCTMNSKCCGNASCIFTTPNPKAMCLSASRVLVSGSFTITNEPFTSYLSNSQSQQYIDFIKNYTQKLECVYSTLSWFDSLTITTLRQGSVIGDFVMLIASSLKSNDLENTTLQLQFNTNATFKLIVTGLVKMTKFPDKDPVLYNDAVNITCITTEEFDKPMWFFKQSASNMSKEITKGNEATVTYFPKESTVNIKYSTEFWKGTFTCDYMSKNASSIIYRASQFLDIALLPSIFTLSDPQFPSCTGEPKSFQILVQCIVVDFGENYRVDWDGDRIIQDIPASLGNGLISYQAFKGIFCDENQEFTSTTCKFTNRQNQTVNAIIHINIITKNSHFCSEDNEWKMAKAGFTAIRLCDSTAVGQKLRNCSFDGIWGDVVPLCVNRDIHDILYDTKDLQRGLGIVEKNANSLFSRLTMSTQQKSLNLFANINASVEVLDSLKNASLIQSSQWNVTVLSDFVKSSSNLLNGSLNDSWTSPEGKNSLVFKFLSAVEGVIKQTNLSAQPMSPKLNFKQDNVQLIIRNSSDNSTPNGLNSNFNVNVTSISSPVSVQTAMKNVISKLPNTLNGSETDPSDVVLSVTANATTSISMNFVKNRLRNHEMYCVFWDSIKEQWSQDGCTWGGADNPGLCHCNHLSSFTILMAKLPTKLKYMEEITYTGLGFSIASLVLSLVIEFLVWNAVVKSNIAHFRHTVLVNIMASLLIADCSFLASPTPSSTPSNWCLTLTVLKHFCYLAVFFWMMCLSLGLLHQVIFVFVHLRKKVYLGLCFFLGYVCPFIIVIITFISNNNGETGSYYSNETCWLIYKTMLKGSIHAFLLPVFTIVFVNMFTMVVVISRILRPTLSEGSTHDEKDVARSIVKAVVLLTPTLGITWIFGLFVLMLDLTQEPTAQIVNYAFTIFNSFQGFFILLTTCFGEKKVRDALLKRFRSQKSMNYKSESISKVTSTTKMK